MMTMGGTRSALVAAALLAALLAAMATAGDAQACSAECRSEGSLKALCVGEKTDFDRSLPTCWPASAPDRINLR